ncbi:MAG: VIT and VWA domain-containing protein [Myxococcota bacterium]
MKPLACALLLTALWTTPSLAQDPPTQGVLTALSPDRTPLGACPLEHTSVEMEISGYVARTSVTQRFQNPYRERIEAVYTFPLPEDAAVRNMEMRVGDRVVRADMMRREAARETYESARESGQTASLLDQERPNIFTTSVANIRPGIPLEVTIEYVETLEYQDGEYRLAFPMTVGPRFVPATQSGSVPTGTSGTGHHPDTDRVADASRITPPVAPRGRSGHDISVVVNLDAGVAMGPPRSDTHEIVVARRSPSRARITLASHETIPNRDFVLRWQVSPERVQSGILAHRPDPSTDGYLSVLLQPNAAPPTAEITPKEIIFVLDTSGSMYGRPMNLSKSLMRQLITNLHPRDTFGVLRYDDSTSELSPRPLTNTAANRRRALAFVAGLEGSGGTDALGGIRAAFDYPHDPDRLRIVVFLSDGYIGNENEIFAEIRDRIGNARLFGFGVGSSVNRHLLEGMGIEGRGTTEIVTLERAPQEQVVGFYKRLQSPYLTDIEVDWGGLAVESPFPARIPDLFAGQPLQVHARYRQPGSGTVTIRGKLAGRPFEQRLAVTLPAQNVDHSAVASIWARQRIAALTRTMVRGENEATVEEITQVAIRHRLMTPYTSFVAVEHRVVEEADATGPSRQVVVPVELPDGVSPERLFQSSLSLARFQPGDPELRVGAPPNARQVTAVFPFGDTHDLTYEPRLDAWTTRFLVPRDTAEGNYHIAVVVTLADGTQRRILQPYTVDGSPPDVDVSFLDPVRAGAEVRIRAEQRFTDADRALHGRLRTEIRSDVARLRITMNGTAIDLAMVEPGVWEGTLAIPDDVDEDLALSVTAFDVAGNRGERSVAIEVEALAETTQ